VAFRPRQPGHGFLGITVAETFRVDRARICLVCGYVMLALTPASLAELRWKIGNLQPFEPR
jgi:hypothetical protein